MKNTFIYHSKEDVNNIKKFWENGIFIFDANVLLNLYRYEKETAEDMLGVLENLKGRVWIPYQVGMEFHKNRLATIADQNRKFSHVKIAIEKIRETSRSSLEALKTKRDHALMINIVKFGDQIKNLLGEFDKELDALKQEQQDVTDQDPILDRINKIFDQRVGIQPDQNKIDAIYLDGINRYKQKRPPGYKDIDKGEKDADLYFYAGVLYKGRYGDLVAWKQIIDYAKENKLENVIFITDDSKEDWWYQIDSLGKKTLGPQPELIHEIRKEAGVSNFLMYQFQQFLKYAQDYLNIEVSAEAISEVRQVTLEQNILPKDGESSSSESWQKYRAIDLEILKLYTEVINAEDGTITYKKNNSEEQVIIAAITHDGENISSLIFNILSSMSEKLSLTECNEAHAFICLDDVDVGWQIKSQLMNTHYLTIAPKKITITIGTAIFFNNEIIFVKFTERTFF